MSSSPSSSCTSESKSAPIGGTKSLGSNAVVSSDPFGRPNPETKQTRFSYYNSGAFANDNATYEEKDKKKAERGEEESAGSASDILQSLQESEPRANDSDAASVATALMSNTTSARQQQQQPMTAATTSAAEELSDLDTKMNVSAESAEILLSLKEIEQSKESQQNSNESAKPNHLDNYISKTTTAVVNSNDILRSLQEQENELTEKVTASEASEAAVTPLHSNVPSRTRGPIPKLQRNNSMPSVPLVRSPPLPKDLASPVSTSPRKSTSVFFPSPNNDETQMLQKSASAASPSKTPASSASSSQNSIPSPPNKNNPYVQAVTDVLQLLKQREEKRTKLEADFEQAFGEYYDVDVQEDNNEGVFLIEDNDSAFSLKNSSASSRSSNESVGEKKKKDLVMLERSPVSDDEKQPSFNQHDAVRNRRSPPSIPPTPSLMSEQQQPPTMPTTTTKEMDLVAAKKEEWTERMERMTEYSQRLSTQMQSRNLGGAIVPPPPASMFATANNVLAENIALSKVQGSGAPDSAVAGDNVLLQPQQQKQQQQAPPPKSNQDEQAVEAYRIKQELEEKWKKEVEIERGVERVLLAILDKAKTGNDEEEEGIDLIDDAFASLFISSESNDNEENNNRGRTYKTDHTNPRLSRPSRSRSSGDDGSSDNPVEETHHAFGFSASVVEELLAEDDASEEEDQVMTQIHHEQKLDDAHNLKETIAYNERMVKDLRTNIPDNKGGVVSNGNYIAGIPSSPSTEQQHLSSPPISPGIIDESFDEGNNLKNLYPPHAGGGGGGGHLSNHEVPPQVLPSLLPYTMSTDGFMGVEAIHVNESNAPNVGDLTRSPNHESGTPDHSLPDVPEYSEHDVLGPLSKKMGGTTGVVLDDDYNEGLHSSPKQQKPITQQHLDDPASPSLLESISAGASTIMAAISSNISNDATSSNISAEANDDNALHRFSTDESAGWSPSSGGEGYSEDRALMRALCSHLLPYGVDKPVLSPERRGWDVRIEDSFSLAPRPSWDEDDPDENGYTIHRLSKLQIRRVEREFEAMVDRARQNSQLRLMGGDRSPKDEGYQGPNNNFRERDLSAIQADIAGSNDEEFERDLEEAEMLLDQEERRQEAVEKSAAAKRISERVSSGESDTSDSDSEQSSECSYSDDEKHSPQEMDAGVSSPSTGQLLPNPDFPNVLPSGQGKEGQLEFFCLPIIYKSHQTGFEPTKDLRLEPGNVFAGQYLVQSELGSAAFSTAYRCIDLSSGKINPDDGEQYHEEVCLKVIKNTKDFFDQSLDEIKILEFLRRTGQCQQNNIVEMKTFFYHREHLIIVTELLRQNLFEFGKFIIDNNEVPYFTRKRLCYITRQILVSLKFIHELGLVHSDVKPENILLASYSKARVKLIDFGSSCYLSDRQSSYIQSRSYRAPEVILGLPYDGKIDVWSLGCVVAEMYTGLVTFQNDSVVSMLSRIEAVCGPFPRRLIAQGRYSGRFFTPSGLLYERAECSDDDSDVHSSSVLDFDDADETGVMTAEEDTLYNIFQPKVTTLAARLGFDADLMEQRRGTLEEEDKALFVDFLRSLLTIDPDSRPTAAEALKHPWILSGMDMSEKDIRYPPE